MYYSIKVRGHLDGSWSEWFGGMTINNLDNGDALMSGYIPDDDLTAGLPPLQ